MHTPWPALPPLADWQEAHDTLHRWLQIVGKVKLAHAPALNHSWEATFYLTARGITTGPMHRGDRCFQIDLDLLADCLWIERADGERRDLALAPMSVATFYRRVMEMLGELDLETRIWPVPVEIPGDVVPFTEDEEHAAYDPEVTHRLWRAMLSAERVFTDYRARFLGKSSPVHLFWGALDLALTRFSGRTAPLHPGGAPNVADRVMQEAYSHEVASAGFWPGAGLGEPAFYAYAYPEPEGYRDADVRPAAAHYHEELGEYVLPYEAVRAADDPDAALMSFLQTTYEAAADLGEWDRKGLERVAAES
jgi:hypothetical protein